MEHKSPEHYSKNEANTILLSNNVEQICDMLVGVAFNEENPEYALFIIYQALNNTNLEVKGLAITCLTHLLRIHGKIPEDRVIEMLKIIVASNDSQTKEIRSRIRDAFGDFSVNAPRIYREVVEEFPEYFRELGFDV